MVSFNPQTVNIPKAAAREGAPMPSRSMPRRYRVEMTLMVTGRFVVRESTNKGFMSLDEALRSYRAYDKLLGAGDSIRLTARVSHGAMLTVLKHDHT